MESSTIHFPTAPENFQKAQYNNVNKANDLMVVRKGETMKETMEDHDKNSWNHRKDVTNVEGRSHKNRCRVQKMLREYNV